MRILVFPPRVLPSSLVVVAALLAGCGPTGPAPIDDPIAPDLIVNLFSAPPEGGTRVGSEILGKSAPARSLQLEPRDGTGAFRITVRSLRPDPSADRNLWLSDLVCAGHGAGPVAPGSPDLAEVWLPLHTLGKLE